MDVAASIDSAKGGHDGHLQLLQPIRENRKQSWPGQILHPQLASHGGGLRAPEGVCCRRFGAAARQ